MPRTENDTRTPYQKATGRRVQRGLRLVEEMKAELFNIERALLSGQFIYTTGIGEQAARLHATMSELDALSEMHDDAEAVAAMARIPDMDLNEAQSECLTQIDKAKLAIYNPRTAEWVWENQVATTRIFRELADMGLVREIAPDHSNALYFEITQLGREIAGRL